MKKSILFILAIFTFFQISIAQNNQNQAKAINVSYQMDDVVDIAISSEEHTTLVTAVKAAGLVSTLKGEGPFTVFAPTNAAFNKLPDGTVATLLKAENKEKLTSILTYHVVAGNFASTDVVKALEKGNGKFTVKTVNGAELTIVQNGEKIQLMDGNGNYATITAVDLKGSNGVIHVIDTVVMP